MLDKLKLGPRLGVAFATVLVLMVGIAAPGLVGVNGMGVRRCNRCTTTASWRWSSWANSTAWYCATLCW